MFEPSTLNQWRERIREGSNMTFPLVGGKKERVTPAEQIRYEENLRFGRMIASILFEFTRHREFTREALVEEGARWQKDLHLSQQKVFSAIFEEALNDQEDAEKCSLKERIEYIDRALEKTAGFTLRLHLLPPEDIEQRPFGVTVVHVRDEGVWRNGLGVFSDGASGFRIGFVSKTQIALRELKDEERISSKAVASKPLTQLEKDHLKRVVFVLDPAKTDERDREEIIQHEVAHVYFDRWACMHLPVREQTECAKTVFLAMKDELIAYMLRHRWEFFLGHLLNIPVEDDARLNWRILDVIAKEYQTEDPTDESTSRVKAMQVANQIWTVRLQMMRLNLLGSKEFDRGISAMIGAQSFKELAYQLSIIDRRTIDLIEISTLPSGEFDIPRLHSAIFLASNGLTKVRFVQEARQKLERFLLDNAESAARAPSKNEELARRARDFLTPKK